MENERKLNGPFLADNRTKIRIQPASDTIQRKQSQVWLGSCFVESMEKYISGLGYPATFNPLGVVYHPLVLANLVNPDFDLKSLCFEKGGVWLNANLGREFGSSSPEDLMEKITRGQKILTDSLRESDWVVMTWGTAIAYRHKELGLVGKNHKMPGRDFTRSFSSVSEIAGTWIPILENWRKERPGQSVVLTLSPVRHTREGLEENSRSKAILRLAIEEIRQALPGIFYFPAYEILVDDLRDYRYFGPDGVHPNAQALAYIQEAFSLQFFPPQEREENSRIMEYQRVLVHRPVHPFGEEYEKWRKYVGELAATLPTRVQK